MSRIERALRLFLTSTHETVNLIAASSISVNMRRITRQLGHGMLMGVLSIVAGVMLTLAVAANDTSGHGSTAQAAMVTQQSEEAPVDTDDSEEVRIIVRLIERPNSNERTRSNSDVKYLQLYFSSEQPTTH